MGYHGSGHTDGEYLRNNPTWHIEDSPWKAENVLSTLARNSIEPKTVCEVGCGAGEILRQLHAQMPGHVRFVGYDISPQAIELARSRESERLTFEQEDLLHPENQDHFDLVIAADVFEHVEDCFGFCRRLSQKAIYKLYHIPLDMTVSAVLRGRPIMDNRRSIGHIHYFCKDTALALLEDTNHTIVDWHYTTGAFLSHLTAWKTRLARLPRRATFALNQDFAARVLGGFSLMVLAK
jgi:cyclopropane fatty-acyl-phospholipid synthase-like methyltransferase